MAAAHVSPKEMAFIMNTSYCVFAAGALLVYDWLLCLHLEVRYIWKWRARVTLSTLVYTCSRYGMLLHNLLVVATVYPMSDVRYGCAADLWTQTVFEILGLVSFSAFSALRAYVLSNRNIFLTALIIVLVVPPVVIFIVQCFYQAPLNLPSPYNCSADSTLPAALQGTTYQSYRVRKVGIDFGRSLSSLLVYNGSIYFLFLASLYIIDLIFQTATVPPSVANADNFLQLFYDPITSILVCHFMLSLRQFDSELANPTSYIGAGTQSRDHTVSTVIRFGAQPSESLPPFIASFAHPVHVDWSLSESDLDFDGETDAGGVGEDDGRSEWREMDVVAAALETPSCQSLAPDRKHAPDWQRSV
ncbi:hypothetical protein V8D89_001212 [Ganoderma adspersum]